MDRERICKCKRDTIVWVDERYLDAEAVNAEEKLLCQEYSKIFNSNNPKATQPFYVKHGDRPPFDHLIYCQNDDGRWFLDSMHERHSRMEALLSISLLEKTYTRRAGTVSRFLELHQCPNQ
jgi:hypothetical protein